MRKCSYDHLLLCRNVEENCLESEDKNEFTDNKRRVIKREYKCVEIKNFTHFPT